MSFGTLSDMVVIGALEFSLTHRIIQKKFPDLIRSLEANNYSFGYLEFLATARWELDEFELDKKYFTFSSPMDEEQKEVYDACL